ILPSCPLLHIPLVPRCPDFARFFGPFSFCVLALDPISIGSGELDLRIAHEHFLRPPHHTHVSIDVFVPTEVRLLRNEHRHHRLLETGRSSSLMPMQSPEALEQRSEEHTSELQSRENLVC